MKNLKKLTASALLLCMLAAMLVVPAAAAPADIQLFWSSNGTDFFPLSYLEYRNDEINVTVTQLKAVYADGSPLGLGFEWTSGHSIATLLVDQHNNSLCTLTPTAPGFVTITVTSKDDPTVFKTFDVIVQPIVQVDSVAITPPMMTLVRGDTSTLSVSVSPADATVKAVEWRSDNDAVATVVDGTVTAVAAGTATITATAKDGSSKQASCTVNVLPSISLNKSSTELVVDGSGEVLTATVSDDATVTWGISSGDAVRVNSTTGAIIPERAGTAIVTAAATANGQSNVASCTVYVSDPVTPAITVKSASEGWGRIDFSPADLLSGKEIRLIAEQNISGGTGDFSWSAAPADVISLTQGSDFSQYTIKPLKVGVTTITVSKAGCTSATFPVQVYGVSDITLNATSLNLATGSSSILIPTVSTVPADGDKTVSWSSDSSAVATVAADGTVSAVAPGTATITASSGGKSVTCAVTVTDPLTPAITVKSASEGWGRIDFSPADLLSGKEIRLIAEQNISGGTGDFSWSAAPADVISLTQGSDFSQYTIKPLKVGVTTITVSKAGCTSATFPVQVYGVSDITLNTTSLNLTTGSSSILIPTVSTVPADGDKTVSWSSSDDGIATVVDGMVTAVAPGTATITASSGGKSVTCAVTVTDPVTAAVTVTGDYDGMALVFNNDEIGAAASNVSKTASCDTATGDFTWAVVSGDPAVVALKISGTNNSGCVISPKAIGSCVIGVSRGAATPAYINVTVKGPEIESFTLPAELSLEAGKDEILTPVISFKDGTHDTPAHRAVTWSIVPGTNGITVDTTGKVSVAANTPVNTEAVVTCTSAIDSTKTASCKIKVSQSIIPVTAVTLDKPTLALSTTGVSRTYKLTATVTPANATNKTVTWTSGNSAVATVANDGTVTAIAPGIANITATAGGVSAVCTVSVTTGTTTGPLTITPSPRSISAIGGYSELTASIPNALGIQQTIPSDQITWSIDTTRSNGKGTFSRVGSRVFLYGSSVGTVIVTGSYVSDGITYTGQVGIGITPMLTYGNYSAYDGKNHMRFLTNEAYPGDPSRVSVIVDGYALTHGMHCYTQSAPNGYVMVTLNSAFLNTLNPSVVHTIQIGTPGNLATGYFRSYGHSSSIYGVRTGDESQPALWAALCIMSLLGAGTILISRRKDWKA